MSKSESWRKQKIVELKTRIEKLTAKAIGLSEEIVKLNRSRGKSGFFPKVCRMWREHARLSLYATKKKIQNLQEQIGWYK